MKVGDLIEWAWWSASPSGSDTEVHTIYRGVVVGERFAFGERMLIVVDHIGPVEVRASEAGVISEGG